MQSSVSALNLAIVVVIYNNYKSSGRNHSRVFSVLLCFGVLLRPTKSEAIGGGGMANGTPRIVISHKAVKFCHRLILPTTKTRTFFASHRYCAHHSECCAKDIPTRPALCQKQRAL
jgi:hypothetical protein